MKGMRLHDAKARKGEFHLDAVELVGVLVMPWSAATSSVAIGPLKLVKMSPVPTPASYHVAESDGAEGGGALMCNPHIHILSALVMPDPRQGVLALAQGSTGHGVARSRPRR